MSDDVDEWMHDFDIWKLAWRLAEGVTDPASLSLAAARAMLRGRTRAELCNLAAGLILERARDFVRDAVREEERRAERQAEAESEGRAEAQDPFHKMRHGSMSKRHGAAYHGCGCDECKATRAFEHELWVEYHQKTRRILDDFLAAKRVEWNDELLAMSFAVDGTGTTVTWGGASVEQHEARIKMLTRNVSANLEAARRHQAAIVDITATPGARCLADVVSAAGAA